MNLVDTAGSQSVGCKVASRRKIMNGVHQAVIRRLPAARRTGEPANYGSGTDAAEA